MAKTITSTVQRPRADRRSHWLLRIGIAVAALAYAALAIGNGLDRMASVAPGAARHLPKLFATNSLAVIGQADLSRDPRAALALAERLVARAPVEPASTALLGAARAEIGDDAGADRAYHVAGQLGWRIPLTQSYLEAEALESGDAPVAAQRLDALLRLQPQLLRDPAVLAPFESDPAAQSALVDRLATRPPWLGIYTGQFDPPPADMLVRRVPTLLLLGERGIVLGCDAITPAMRQLISAGLAAPADALRRRHCPGAK